MGHKSDQVIAAGTIKFPRLTPKTQVWRVLASTNSASHWVHSKNMNWELKKAKKSAPSRSA